MDEDSDKSQGLGRRLLLFARLMQSEDRQEFARALQEKRAPVYRGP